MGRPRPSYEYPQVHPPRPQAQYQPELQIEPNVSMNSRYSYMITPVEKRSGQSFHATNTQSPPPPLPTVPDHLNNGLQLPLPQAAQSRPPSRAKTPAEQMLNQYQELTKQQEAIEYQRANTPQGSNRPMLHFQTPRTQTPQPAYTAQSSYVPQTSFPTQYDNTLMLQYSQHRSTTPLSTNVSVPQYRQQTPFQTQPTDISDLPEVVKVAPDHPNYRDPSVSNQNDGRSIFSAEQKPSSSNHAPLVSSLTVPAVSTYKFHDYTPTPQAATGGTWAHDLYSCSEPNICFTGLFCPCVLYGRVQHRLSLRSSNKDPANTTDFNSFNGPCVAWTFACGINGILSGIQKTRVRRTYGMESGSGNIFSDCLKGCCCCCCTLAQSEKEIVLRERKCRKQIAQEGYVPPITMSFRPPSR